MKQHNQQQFSQFKGRAGFKAKNVELDSKSRMTASVFVVVVVVKTTTTNPETKNIVRVWLILLLVVLTPFFFKSLFTAAVIIAVLALGKSQLVLR